jgi:3-hydroxy-9,10-secoandrosta-1,3,5(10)-triene-9,17-dione monooxygenase reductase component
VAPSSLDEGRFREVLGHFASGLVVAAGIADGRPVGFTCQAFASASLDPPLVLFCPSRASTTWPRLRSAGVVGLSILEARQESLARAFSASGADKFAGVGWTPSAGGAPLLDGALAWLEVEPVAVHEAGDHHVVVARVLDLVAHEGEPLVFYRGGYGAWRP